MPNSRPKTIIFGVNQKRLLPAYRAALLAGAASILMGEPALAQTTTAANANTVEQVVVTGSRIQRDGYASPTPTVVVGTEAIENQSFANIGDALFELPVFKPSVSPNAGGIGNNGSYLADLRGLGPGRTLVLLDRGRLPQTFTPGGTAGATDLSVIPTALIRNVDIVTGGASAAYGSDAVSGVVNFQIDDHLEGIKTTAQYSITRYGDAGDGFASVAGGTGFADGRGHVVAAVEYNKDDGTSFYNDKREWGKENWGQVSFTNCPAGLPQSISAKNGNLYGAATGGGLIQTAGALQGLAFVPATGGGVTTAVFQRGIGNLTTSLDVFTDAQVAANKAAGIININGQELRASANRVNMLSKASFDITDHVTAYVEALYADVNTLSPILFRRDGAGAGAALAFAKDNFYLQKALTPAQLALVPATGLSIGYTGQNFGPNQRHTQKNLVRVQAGLTGDLDLLGSNWKWDAAYTYGEDTGKVAISNDFNNVNFMKAIDVVSSGGQPVCRSIATSPDCQPINILGAPVVSSAAQSYILGTATGVGYSGLQEITANIQGEPFSIWAGPVSIGTGMDYRKESISDTVDPLSATSSWLTSAGSALAAVKDDVKEAYIETVVPLARDMTFAKTIDLNAAVRETEYSTSGDITTWKVGLTWEPMTGLLVRSTRSADIRAPNLIELFAPQTPSLPLPTDPRPGVPRPTNSAGFVTGGNPNLKPENAITQTLGFAYTPDFISNLQTSVDWYQIQIKNAIASTGTAGVITNCFVGGLYTGNSYCKLITFANNDVVNGQITAVQGVNANVASSQTRGLDVQITYRLALADINQSLPGDVTLNMTATHAISSKASTSFSVTFPNGVDTAGSTGGNPSWLLNLGATYRLDKIGLNGNMRYISKSRISNSSCGPLDACYNPALTTSSNLNLIQDYAYFDVGATYDFGDDKRRQLFFNIANLFDTNPPLPASGTYYDLFGRTFKGGIRVNF